MLSCQKLGTILLNKFPWEWFIFKILLMKVVLLIKYSDKKIIFRKIQLSFGLQNWLWKLKMSNFWQSSIKMPYKISKNPFRRLIQMQKSIEFQLHHWEIPQLSSFYCIWLHVLEWPVYYSQAWSNSKWQFILHTLEYLLSDQTW